MNPEPPAPTKPNNNPTANIVPTSCTSKCHPLFLAYPSYPLSLSIGASTWIALEWLESIFELTDALKAAHDLAKIIKYKLNDNNLRDEFVYRNVD